MGAALLDFADTAGKVGAQLRSVGSRMAFGGFQMALEKTSFGDPVAFEQFNFAVRDLAGVFGQMLSPIVREATGYVREAADWLVNLSDGTKSLVTGFARYAIFIGGGMFVMGRLFTAASAASAALTAMRAGAISMSAAAGIAGIALGAFTAYAIEASTKREHESRMQHEGKSLAELQAEKTRKDEAAEKEAAQIGGMGMGAEHQIRIARVKQLQAEAGDIENMIREKQLGDKRKSSVGAGGGGDGSIMSNAADLYKRIAQQSLRAPAQQKIAENTGKTAEGVKQVLQVLQKGMSGQQKGAASAAMALHQTIMNTFRTE